jgi:shikimate kinase
MRNSAKKPLVLVGMMGSGKSTVGKRLAYKLNLQFYDSDKIIEEREGLSINDIYEYKGEDYFKSQEVLVIKELLSYGTVIISTGGGSFLIDEVRELITTNSTSIWLRTDIDTIYERVSRRNTRPLLNTADKMQTIVQLIQDATPVYEQADIIVDSNNYGAHFVVDTIIQKLKNFSIAQNN